MRALLLLILISCGTAEQPSGTKDELTLTDVLDRKNWMVLGKPDTGYLDSDAFCIQWRFTHPKSYNIFELGEFVTKFQGKETSHTASMFSECSSESGFVDLYFKDKTGFQHTLSTVYRIAAKPTPTPTPTPIKSTTSTVSAPVTTTTVSPPVTSTPTTIDTTGSLYTVVFTFYYGRSVIYPDYTNNKCIDLAGSSLLTSDTRMTYSKMNDTILKYKCSMVERDGKYYCDLSTSISNCTYRLACYGVGSTSDWSKKSYDCARPF